MSGRPLAYALEENDDSQLWALIMWVHGGGGGRYQYYGGFIFLPVCFHHADQLENPQLNAGLQARFK